VTWKYRDIEITMSGPKFVATVQGQLIRSSSLHRCQKAIDRALDELSKLKSIHIPVVILRRVNSYSYSFDKDRPDIYAHETITGVNPNSHTLEGITPSDNYRNSYILLDTPENEQLLKEWRETSIREAQLKEKISESCIHSRLPEKLTYSECVTHLESIIESRKAASK